MMINYQLLGVFENIYGKGAEMTISKALFISIVGFLIVIVILLLLALVIKAFSTVFGKLEKKTANNEAAAAAEAPAPVAVPVQTVPVSNDPVLEGVSEEEAAVVMAVISHKTGIPLNRLKFNSIKLSEEK